MGDHPERKLFTSVVLPQPPHHHHEHPSLSAANHQTEGGGGGGGYGGSILHVPKRNLHYSRTQMRDCRGNDSDSDSEPESDPDLDPATLLTTRMVGNASYFRTLSQLVPQSQPPPPPPPPQEQQLVSLPQVDPTVVSYRECQKNHAAAMGSHVVDGCGEFMPNGEEGTAEALKCAACSCHRNFHRREVEGELIHQSAAANGNNNHNNTSGSRRREAANHNHHQVAAPFHPPRLPQRFPPLMMEFGRGGNGTPAESSSEHLNSPDGTPGTGTAALAGTPSSTSSRKRFRTKFNQEQKDKMQEFGERLGWKIQKQDEQQVQEFCAEVGVKRQVFKVWMHNSKQASKKKQL